MSTPMDTSNDANQPTTQSTSQSTTQSDSRARARALFAQYVRQFTEGCGRSNCQTSNCASNPSFIVPAATQSTTAQQAAAQLAIQTMKQSHDRQLCPSISQPNSQSNIQSSSQSNGDASSQSVASAPQPLQTSAQSIDQSSSQTSGQISPNKRVSEQISGEIEHQPVTQPVKPIASTPSSQPVPQPKKEPVRVYRYEDFFQLYESCKHAVEQPSSNQSAAQSSDQSSTQPISQPAKSSGNPFAPLVRLVGEVFADLPLLEQMFRPADQPSQTANDQSKDQSSKESNDQDSSQSVNHLIDWNELERTMALLTKEESVNNSLSNATRRLLMNQSINNQSVNQSVSAARVLFMFFFNPTVEDLFDTNDNLRALCKLIHQSLSQSVSLFVKKQLIDWLVDCSEERFAALLDCLQQYVTVKFLINQSLPEVQSIIQSINLLYQANKRRANQIDWRQWQNDAVNQSINQSISLKDDYKRWKLSQMPNSLLNTNHFSLAAHPFILDAAAKSNLLKIDAHYTMNQTMNQSINQTITQSMTQSVDSRSLSPYLVLKIRRDHLIDDTLSQLQSLKPINYRKPLKVQFAHEQGIDEGGVKKEFFQLIIAQLMDLQYGMFTTNADKSVGQPNSRSNDMTDESTVAPDDSSMADSTDQSTDQATVQSADHDSSDHGHFMLFNPVSFESSREFELVGVVLGLALYNSVILDVKFPLYYYKKLLNGSSTDQSASQSSDQTSQESLKESLNDLNEINPQLAKGLQTLLDHDQSTDIQSIYQRTFTIDVDMFGETTSVDLIKNGPNIHLTWENREEYVRLYVNYVLHQSIKAQFTSFQKGFDRCVDRSILSLFEPEQLQLAVVGSDELDFEALEESAQYEGYTEDHPLIKQFWEVVHSFDQPMKKKLLSFCTGSDRVPIRGLGALRLTIAKNGDDSELLPTSSTCFNVLLLPEYKQKEKMEKYLRLALHNGIGFGLI